MTQAYNIVRERMAREAAEKAATVARENQGHPDLERMTIKALRQYAKDHGMSTATKLGNKTELIKAIRKFGTRGEVA